MEAVVAENKFSFDVKIFDACVAVDNNGSRSSIFSQLKCDTVGVVAGAAAGGRQNRHLYFKRSPCNGNHHKKCQTCYGMGVMEVSTWSVGLADWSCETKVVTQIER